MVRACSAFRLILMLGWVLENAPWRFWDWRAVSSRVDGSGLPLDTQNVLWQLFLGISVVMAVLRVTPPILSGWMAARAGIQARAFLVCVWVESAIAGAAWALVHPAGAGSSILAGVSVGWLSSGGMLGGMGDDPWSVPLFALLACSGFFITARRSRIAV